MKTKSVQKCSTRQSFIFPKWHSFKIGTLGKVTVFWIQFFLGLAQSSRWMWLKNRHPFPTLPSMPYTIWGKRINNFWHCTIADLAETWLAIADRWPRRTPWGRWWSESCTVHTAPRPTLPDKQIVYAHCVNWPTADALSPCAAHWSIYPFAIRKSRI